MKKIFTKLIGVTLGLAMAVGVGVGVAAGNRVAKGLNADDGSITFSSGSFSNDVITWSSSGLLTVVQTKNTGSTAPNSSYVSNPRWYTGNKVTFTPGSGKTITKMIITATSNSYATALANSTWSTGTASASNAVVTWTGSSSEPFNVVLGGQSRLDTSMSFTHIPTPSTFSVTYFGNGSTSGTVPVDETEYESGDSVTVLGNVGSLQKEVAGITYSFNGWNTLADGSGVSRAVGSEFSITGNVELYAQWTEQAADSGAITYTLANMNNFNNWNSSYSQRTDTFTTEGVGTAAVTLSAAAKPTSGSIVDTPVMKDGTAVFVLSSETHYIKAVTFHARQWGSKDKTITMYSSNDGGNTWGDSLVSTSTVFVTRISNLSSGVNAFKIQFGGTADNQIGLVDFVVTYAALPSVEATTMTISPASLSLYGGEQGTFTPTLSGGTGDYEKTIVWTSTHPSIIAAPANSEAGEAVNVTPAPVAADTPVTLTGTVDVIDGATASIVITVKLIKTVSVSSVSLSGIENNSTLNGSNDNTITVDKTIQLSATVNYEQGDAYMDGNNGVSWISNNESAASVSSAGLVTLHANGTVTITATSTENTNKSASLTFTISNIKDHLGTENNPYTVAQAKAAIDAGSGTSGVYVTGIVSQVDSFESNSITYWISADGTTADNFEVYKGKGASGANFNSINDILIGATVVIYGNIKQFNSVYEFAANSQLVSYVAPSDDAVLDYYLGTASSIATINGVEHRTSDVEPESIVFADLGLSNQQQYLDPFDGGHFTITFSGGSNDGKYYTTGAGIRTYAGGSFTIASDTESISKIELTWDTPADNKPTSDEIVNVGSYDAETFIWTGNNSSVTFTRPSGSGHWRLKAVEVTYGVFESVDSVTLRFGASIPVSSWEAINSCDNLEITDYGVMLYKVKPTNLASAPSIESLYETNPSFLRVYNKGSGTAPTAENGNYPFTARISYPDDSEYGNYIIARAFVVINGTDYRFVGQEMRKTVRLLAASNDGTNLSPEALASLAS